MGDPTRLAVLKRLSKGELPVTRLAEGSNMAMPSFLQHLKVLEAARLISTRKQGRSRFCKLDPVAMSDAARWIEEQRRTWNARLDNLVEFVSRPDFKESEE